MNITFRDIVWVAIIALIVIILSKCHRDKANSLNKDVAALLNERRMTDSAHSDEVQDLENRLYVITGQLQNAQADQRTAEQRLNKSVTTAGRLSAELKRLRDWPTDTNAIMVGGEYVTYCDSLAFTADSLIVDYTIFKRKNTILLAGKDTAISIQKQLYDKERAAREQCKRDFEALTHYYKLADNRAKPVSQVFMGAELLGNRQLLIQNVGIAVSLKTKTNKLWQVSGGLQNGGGWYGRINGNILIRLRKN